MTTILANSFLAALDRLGNDEQKQASLTAFQLQRDAAHPSLNFHRIEQSRDRNFWSVRVSGDIRIIVHKTGDSVLLCHVGHHDEAYKWAERRRIEAHPTTGALQIVEVRELVEAARRSPGHSLAAFLDPDAPDAPPAPRIFAALTEADLLSIGVPADWIADVQAATDDGYFALHDHLPPEAGEALLEYADTRRLPVTPPRVADPLQHPDTQRRFRVVEGIEELRAALDAPFERWAVFLHPSQRDVVERRQSGPARVVGSAGTGKTVVALHRVVRLIESAPTARALLTTFSDPLSRSLADKLRILIGERPDLLSRTSVASFERVATQLYFDATAKKPRMATAQAVRTALRAAADAADVTEITSQFLHSEWDNVIDEWQIDSAEAYGEVARMGRKTRLGPRQRERLWPVFARVREDLLARGLLTRPALFAAATALWRDRADKPYTHVVVDEAQDLGVPELRFLAALAGNSPEALFLAGDLGQRIFRQPFSWRQLGVDVRGRSATLKVNYRTSHQIRRAADRLLPGSVRDADGLEDERAGTISVFDGPDPEVMLADDANAERDLVAGLLAATLAEGTSPSEIGIFVRSDAELPRARAAARGAGLAVRRLLDKPSEDPMTVLVDTMHLAKGLEFRVVVLMACDEDVLPLAERVAAVADAYELDEVRSTERQLLYVAATRARDRLIVSGVKPGSEFLDYFSGGG